MSHYRKIDVRIWNDEKFNSLSADGKLAFLMLLSHPMMTALGAMRATPEGLAAELDGNGEGKADAYRDAYRDIFAKGMADYDPQGRLIALPNFLRYNPPTSINVVKAWAGLLDFLPECPLRTVVIQRAVAFAQGMGKGFADAIPDAMRYPESREQRAKSRDSQQRHIQEEETSQGRRIRTRERIDEDGVVHEEPWGGLP